MSQNNIPASPPSNGGQINALPGPMEYLVILVNLTVFYYTSCWLDSWLLGLASVYLLNMVKRHLILRLLDLEELTGTDYFFLYDNEKNRCNILTTGIFEKVDLEKAKAQFKERALRYPRMRQRLYRLFSSSYWKKIPDEEFEKMVDSLIIDLADKPIHNED